MTNLVDQLGGPTALSRMTGVSVPSVISWRKRGSIPELRCPAIERGTAGAHTCEALRPDITWHRVPDAAWPWHPQGRPLIDPAAGIVAAD